FAVAPFDFTAIFESAFVSIVCITSSKSGFLFGARTDSCRSMPEQPSEEEDLVYAVEVGALVGRLAMEREFVFFGDAHLYFQRTVPSFTSSTMIPESASCLRISSERLKSRRFLAA